jgi:hypothetical protein
MQRSNSTECHDDYDLVWMAEENDTANSEVFTWRIFNIYSEGLRKIMINLAWDSKFLET